MATAMVIGQKRCHAPRAVDPPASSSGLVEARKAGDIEHNVEAEIFPADDDEHAPERPSACRERIESRRAMKLACPRPVHTPPS